MTTLFKGSLYQLFLCSIIFCGSQILLVNCTEFEVGGHDGWVVPKSRDNDQMYNQWASQNRFKVGDTLHSNMLGEKSCLLDVQEHAQPAPAPQSENVNVTEPHSKAGGAAEICPISTTTSALFILSLFGLLYA